MTLKNELDHRYRFDARARVRLAVADYIKLLYNGRRKHAALRYRAPASNQ